MASAAQLAQFNRRGSAGNSVAVTPIRELPDVALLLDPLADRKATSAHRKEALKKLKTALDDWRKALKPL